MYVIDVYNPTKYVTICKYTVSVTMCSMYGKLVYVT